MLRLVLGKLYDGAALLPGKLDARLRRMAEAVNNGLTSANLDPAYALPAARFREARSTFQLQARFINTDSAVALNCLSAPVPVACRLEHAKLVVYPGGVDDALSLYYGKRTTGPETLIDSIVVTENMPRYEGVYPGGTLRLYECSLGAAPVELAAGQQVWFSYGAGGGFGSGHATFRFSVPHAA